MCQDLLTFLHTTAYHLEIQVTEITNVVESIRTLARKRHNATLVSCVPKTIVCQTVPSVWTAVRFTVYTRNCFFCRFAHVRRRYTTAAELSCPLVNSASSWFQVDRLSMRNLADSNSLTRKIHVPRNKVLEIIATINSFRHRLKSWRLPSSTPIWTC